jgi:hypothetical protein
MKEKYNERVRAIAEEMVKETPQKSGSNSLDRQVYTRIAVAHMAKAAEDALRAAGIIDSKEINVYLKREGLIPDSAQDGDTNGEEPCRHPFRERGVCEDCGDGAEPGFQYE